MMASLSFCGMSPCIELTVKFASLIFSVSQSTFRFVLQKMTAYKNDGYLGIPRKRRRFQVKMRWILSEQETGMCRCLHRCHWASLEWGLLPRRWRWLIRLFYASDYTKWNGMIIYLKYDVTSLNFAIMSFPRRTKNKSENVENKNLLKFDLKWASEQSKKLTRIESKFEVKKGLAKSNLIIDF